MHKIFVTEGLVLVKRGAGEANTTVALFTKELGLIRASARSARLAKSKLRYGLETLTQARFSLVRGRYEWKLVGVEGPERALLVLPKNSENAETEGAEQGSFTHTQRRASLARITKLLLRLIHGEESVPELYALVTDGLTHLARAESQKDAESIECVLVLRVLANLGYLPQTTELAPFMPNPSAGPPVGGFFSLELADEVARSRPFLIRTINESLTATGL
ncbi:MAG: recombination protein O N-terminal domain-containing protein [bacterium]